MKKRGVSTAMFVIMALTSQAVHSTWTGKAKGNNWTAAGNWNNGIPNSISDSVVFRDTRRVGTTLNTGFTLGSGQTMTADFSRGDLVFRVGDLGATGELRFAAGSTLAFDHGGIITEQGKLNQRIVIEDGATLSALRYYPCDSFTTIFEAGRSGVTTFYTTDSSGACSLRTRGALVVDLTGYTGGAGDLVLFDYVKRSRDVFSLIKVMGASGELVEGVDFTFDYAGDLWNERRGVVISIISRSQTLGLIY